MIIIKLPITEVILYISDKYSINIVIVFIKHLCKYMFKNRKR